MSKVWIVVSFRINHDFIAKYLCEKKDIPQNHCDGNCWLKKELNKSEDLDKNQLPSLKIEIPECNFLSRDEENKMKDLLSIADFNFGPYQKHIHISDFLASIFHPPKQKPV